jgi:hypothetical protein
MEPEKKQKLEEKEQKLEATDHRHKICFSVILDFLSHEDLPAMFASCVEVSRVLKNHPGFVFNRWWFGALAKNIVKKEVFDWYLARLSSEGTFGAPRTVQFIRWFSEPGEYQQGLFETCLWHDSVPLLELLLEEVPSDTHRSADSLKKGVLRAMKER